MAAYSSHTHFHQERLSLAMMPVLTSGAESVAGAISLVTVGFTGVTCRMDFRKCSRFNVYASSLTLEALIEAKGSLFCNSLDKACVLIG